MHLSSPCLSRLPSPLTTGAPAVRVKYSSLGNLYLCQPSLVTGRLYHGGLLCFRQATLHGCLFADAPRKLALLHILASVSYPLFNLTSSL